MATYKDIKGTSVQIVSSDPSNPVIGQIWYNTSSNTLKGFELQLEAWTTAAPFTGVNPDSNSKSDPCGAGTQTAALMFGSLDAPNTIYTLEYNGTSWTTGGDMGTQRTRLSGGGTQTAAFAAGGKNPSNSVTATCEEYNGTAWTGGGNMNTAREELAAAGIQTAGLIFGGDVDPAASNATEEYDGSSWTNGGSMGTAQKFLAGCGVQTAAVAFGGQQNQTKTEEYDGSSWTAGGNMGTGKYLLGAAGLQTAALAIGGMGGSPNNLCQSYNGTSWTNAASLNTTTTTQIGAAGTRNLALAFGGQSAGGNTEEYNSGGPATVTINDA